MRHGCPLSHAFIGRFLGAKVLVGSILVENAPTSTQAFKEHRLSKGSKRIRMERRETLQIEPSGPTLCA